VGLIDADRAAILPLPPVPLPLRWRNKIRPSGDRMAATLPAFYTPAWA
jgi:hypothetical protein